MEISTFKWVDLALQISEEIVLKLKFIFERLNNCLTITLFLNAQEKYIWFPISSMFLLQLVLELALY